MRSSTRRRRRGRFELGGKKEKKKAQVS